MNAAGGAPRQAQRAAAPACLRLLAHPSADQPAASSPPKPCAQAEGRSLTPAPELGRQVARESTGTDLAVGRLPGQSHTFGAAAATTARAATAATTACAATAAGRRRCLNGPPTLLRASPCQPLAMPEPGQPVLGGESDDEEVVPDDDRHWCGSCAAATTAAARSRCGAPAPAPAALPP